METGRSSRMMRWTSSSMARVSVPGQRPVEREVEAQVVGRDQRARLACPLPDHVPQRAMEQMRARVVAHGVGASLGVHHGFDRLADTQPAVEHAALDDQAAERLLRVGHAEQLAPATRLTQDAVVTDLAAALGIERASGRGRPRPRRVRSARRTPSRHAGWPARGPRPSSSRIRRTGCRRRVRGSSRTAPPARRASRAGPWSPTGCGHVVRRAPDRSRRDRPRTPYSAASSTVRSIGKP